MKQYNIQSRETSENHFSLIAAEWTLPIEKVIGVFWDLRVEAITRNLPETNKDR